MDLANLPEVRMWEGAVQRSSTFRSSTVRESMYGVAYHGPAGSVLLHENNYVSKPFRMGVMNDLGSGFRITAHPSGQDNGLFIFRDGVHIDNGPEPMYLYPQASKTCKFKETPAPRPVPTVAPPRRRRTGGASSGGSHSSGGSSSGADPRRRRTTSGGSHSFTSSETVRCFAGRLQR